MYRIFFKRLIDFVLSLVALILFLPIILIVTVFLTVANQGRPFFIQKRPGRHGVIFNVIKFKTMNDKRDRAGNLLPDRERLTAIGKVVRSTSIDELPQLINVLLGDMSFVGPRPLLVKYLPLYSAAQMRRHEVTPGITGWAQVNGRNSISWDQRFELDVYYVDHLNMALDVKILWLTFKKVLRREGINAEGSATMKAFGGNTTK